MELELTLMRNMSAYASSVSQLKDAALVPEVSHALVSWVKATAQAAGVSKPGVLIGGLALSFYAPPRYTQDVDVLFLSEQDLPDDVPGFVRHRKSAYQEKKTQVEVELTTPASIGIPRPLAVKVFETAKDHSGLKVASREALIALKLFGASNSPKREFKDLADVVSLLEHNPDLPMNEWLSFLSKRQVEMLNDARNRARP